VVFSSSAVALDIYQEAEIDEACGHISRNAAREKFHIPADHQFSPKVEVWVDTFAAGCRAGAHMESMVAKKEKAQ
jgi:hypothetical protein